MSRTKGAGLKGSRELRIPMWVYEHILRVVAANLANVTNPHVGL